MSRIIPSLNLNKTPQSVEDRSLVYAKNIRMFPDQSFGPDNSIVTKVDTDNISKYLGKEDGTLYDIIGHINGLDNNIYLFVSKYKAVQSVYYGDIFNLENITSVNVKTYSKNNDNTKNVIIEKNLTFEELPLEVYKMLQCSVVPFDTEQKALFDLTEYISKGLDEYEIQLEEVGLCFDVYGNINSIRIYSSLINIEEYNPEIISYNNNSYIKYTVNSQIYVYKINNIHINDEGDISSVPIQDGVLNFNENNEILNLTGTLLTINNELHCVRTVAPGEVVSSIRITEINYVDGENELFDFNYPFYFNDACNIIEEGKFNKIGSLSLQKKKIEEDNEENTNEEVEEKIVGFTIKVNNTFYNNLYIELSYYNNNELVKSVDEKLSDEKIKVKDTILEYSELTEAIKEIKSGWKWSGGIIEGITTVNNTNQPIINIGEYFKEDTGVRVPIKHINVKECKETDDESIYTQAPNVPLTNFILTDTFTHSIPNGVYQFFVRYKIRDNFYTNWFVCSKECFAGSRELTNTIFGSMAYVKTEGDAGSSFVFSVEYLHPEYFDLYEGYQVGFILTTNEKTIARTWKTFSFDYGYRKGTHDIYFDLNEKDVTEVDIDEMLSTPYNIYNVKNIDYFRGKLYVSNYIEDDFNPTELKQYVNKINIDLKFEHFNINERNDKFAGKILTKIDFPSGSYSHIEDRPIQCLLNNQEYLDLRYYPSSLGKIDHNFDDSLFYMRAVWNSDVDPDLMYIDKCLGTNGIGIPEGDVHDDEGNWKNYFDISDNFIRQATIREKSDENKHWLKGNKYFDGIWYWSEKGNNFGQEYKKINDNAIGTPDALSNYANSLAVKLLQAANENIPNKCLITKITILADNETIAIYDSNASKEKRHDLRGIQMPVANQTDLTSYAISRILDKNNITALNGAGYFYYRHNNEDKLISQIDIEYSEIVFHNFAEVNSENPFNDNGGNTINVKVDNSKHNYNLTVSCCVNTGYFEKNSDKLDSTQYNTLMPYTDYDFYIHYITKNGVITNGIYICSKKVQKFELDETDENNKRNKSLIYPEITGIEIPEQYESCFISYYKHNNNVAECFGITLGNNTDTPTYVNILEADSLLYKLNDNIQIYHKDSYNDKPILIGNYYSSNSTKSDGNVSFDEFGNAGIIKGILNAKAMPYEPDYEDNEIETEPSIATVQGYAPAITNDELSPGEYLTVNAGLVISFNIETNGYSPVNCSPGDLSIFLCVNYTQKTIDVYEVTELLKEVYTNFCNCVFYDKEDIEDKWEAFERYIQEKTNDTGVIFKLVNYENFGKKLNPQEGHRIYPRAKKLYDDGTINPPLQAKVSISPSDYRERDYSYIDIDLWFTGSNVGFSYINEEDNTITYAYENVFMEFFDFTCWENPEHPDISPRQYSIYDLVLNDTTWVERYDNLIKFEPKQNKDFDGYFWYRNKGYLSIDESAKKLIKLTPYLTYDLNENNKRIPVSFSSYSRMNTDSYICQIVKPDRNASLSTYCSGDDLYQINRTNSDKMGLTLKSGLVASIATDVRYIYSNFNLNYLSLSYDLVPKLRAKSNDQQLYLGIPSSELSNCYKLESMYKDFTRKYFAPYNKYNMTVFDNTIRSSDANTDEVYRCIYRFAAEDMYNVPANRGKITKMFSIGNSIYIHTEHSLFKFSGENTLSGAEKDVKLEESNVFDTGISEVFDSENGYGGLHEKHNCLITYKNYYFYDTRSKLIYSYSGTGELQTINAPIKKLFNFLDVSDVRFGSDLRNDRIFIYLEGAKGNVCLSYYPDSKNYLSIHDINIIDTFNTRNNLYFTSKQNMDVNQKKKGTVSLLNGFDYNSFGNYGNVFAQSPYVTNKELALISTHPNDLYCVIDVIINSNPEDIKNLDNVSWICHHIKNYLDVITSGDYQYYDMDNAAEEAKYKYPGEYIQLYTDSCDTGNIELYDINNVEHRNVDIYGANAYSINNDLSYKYPRYNEGVWNLNYFRNIKGVTGDAADNKSLIYGKYIVARFIFKADYNFKLENVMFNIKIR